MLKNIFAALFCLALLTAPVHAQDFSEAQKAAIDAQIGKYIATHPEALIKSVETHYNKQGEDKSAQEGSLDELPAGLTDFHLTPYIGPNNAKVKVVEFFDYNCGYCKQAARDLQRVIEQERGRVKFVFKELPILAESSETAARWALAANKQGKYLEFHMALMRNTGGIDESVLTRVAKEVGLDVEKLKVEAQSADTQAALDKNMELARILGVRGTPFFVIGKEKIPGAIGYTRLAEMIRAELGELNKPAAKPVTDAMSPEAKAALSESSAQAAQVEKVTTDLAKQAQQMQEEARKMMEEIKKQQAAADAKKK
jgi:protein-disulfide isomerase